MHERTFEMVKDARGGEWHCDGFEWNSLSYTAAKKEDFFNSIAAHYELMK